MLWGGGPEGLDSVGKGSVPQGSMLGSGDGGQEAGVTGLETTGRYKRGRLLRAL